VQKVVRDCQVGPEQLTIVLTPTSSLAGMVQIIARVLEVGLHKAHTLGFPLDAVVDGAASAPLAPPAPDTLTAMGRSNDAILFGGTVQLFVRCEDALAENLAQQLHSQGSRDYGRPFSAVFKDYGYDFYKIDPMLFAPAVAIVTNLQSGRTFRAGGLNDELLKQSFGG
jgi:methenyltetrahydromethanopterin cyclohydrolase